MLVRYSKIIILEGAPYALFIDVDKEGKKNKWLLEPEPDEEKTFIEAFSKILRLGEPLKEDWLEVPLKEFTTEERKILKELAHLGVAKLQDGEKF